MPRLPGLIKEHADPYAFEIAEVMRFGGNRIEAMHWLERAYTPKGLPVWSTSRWSCR